MLITQIQGGGSFELYQALSSAVSKVITKKHYLIY